MSRVQSRHGDEAPDLDDPGLKITLLQHELDEAHMQNVRLRQSLLEPPYSQLRTVIRQYPNLSKPVIKALNVVTGTGRINFHRRALLRLRLPRDLREMEASGLFDASWYADNYPDVARSGLDPLRHYALIGAAQGWDPGPRFSTEFYLDNNPDVSRGTNALLHYLRHGRARGSAIAPSTVQRQWLAFTLDARFAHLRPLPVYASPAAPARISMVTDTIASHGSGEGAAGLILASLLARRMHRPLRIITRRVPPAPAAYRAILEANGIPWQGDVDFVFSSQDTPDPRLVDVASGDLFVATSWWTAWATRASVDPRTIVHLVQDDEQRFYPAGDDSIRCAELLDDSRIRCVVSSKSLFDHLFSGADAHTRAATWFEPAFPGSHTDREHSVPGKRNFMFDARPDNPRSLYYRGLEAISGAMESGKLDPATWDFFFVGTDLVPAALSATVRPTLIRNPGVREYQRLLRRMDLGLSLMASAHPSYPALELGAAGAVVVTNTFGPHRGSLDHYSKNILCRDPDVPSLVAGIGAGVALAADVDRRTANHQSSAFATDWNVVFAPTCDQIAAAVSGSGA
jgi:hypothetical protein